MAQPRREGLRSRRLSPKTEALLTALQSAELIFEASDLFDPVPDKEAAHNHLSLLIPSQDPSDNEVSPLIPLPGTNPNQAPSSRSNADSEQNHHSRNLSNIRPSPGSSSHHQLTQYPMSTPMATTKSLPTCNECSAPKWDSRYEEQLPTFFEEFETVASAAGITEDNEKMKKEVLYYADPKSMMFWRTLPSFKEVTKSWDEFKTEVLSHYPGALQVAEATTKDLKKVVNEFTKSGVSDSKELGTYHRKFAIVASLLQEHGILSGVQIASFYVQAFPDPIWLRLDTRLQVSFPNKTKGQAYALLELHEAIDFLLSDASTTIVGGNFSVGDHSVVPAPSMTSMFAPKVKPANTKLESLTQQIASLTQLVTKIVGNKEKNPSHLPGGNRGKCFWDNCDSQKFDTCIDLKEWVDKERVKRDSNRYVQLKGGQRLPKESQYMEGTLKQWFECYFEDHSLEKSWLLKSPPSTNGVLSGVDISSHSTYTLNGFQGPSMLAKAATYMMDNSNMGEEAEAELICRLIFKMETHHSMREGKDKNSPNTRTDNKNKMTDTSCQPDKHSKSTPDQAVKDPEPFKSIPPGSGPIKPPKPVIGKIPLNYVPPQERSVGVPPGEDTCNF